MKKINKTEQEWREQLTPEQFEVTRNHGTERPFTGELLNESAKGVYHCVCCDTPLFYSDQKFESHCGWPSFDECHENAIQYKKDLSHGMVRIEILCQACDAHLGHVFDDGPTKSGKRYCVNSLSLTFKPAE